MIYPLSLHIARLVLVMCPLLAWGLVFSASGASASSSGTHPTTGPPTIESESVSNITEHGATLEAQISSEGSEAEYEVWLECGVVIQFQCGSAERVGLGRIASGDSGQSVSVAVNNLQSGDRYKYWFVATNSEGAAKGVVRILSPSATWSGPVSDTSTASNITEHSVTLAGEIYPSEEESGEFEYFFEYGPSTSYGTSAPTSQKARTVRFGSCGMICEGENTAPRSVSLEITGLEPGTTYYYRFVATSAGGYRSFSQGSAVTTGGQKTPPSTSSGEVQLPAQSTESSSTAGAALLVAPLVQTAKPIALIENTKLKHALSKCSQESKRKKAICARELEKKYATTARDSGKGRRRRR